MKKLITSSLLALTLISPIASTMASASETVYITIDGINKLGKDDPRVKPMSAEQAALDHIHHRATTGEVKKTPLYMFEPNAVETITYQHDVHTHHNKSRSYIMDAIKWLKKKPGFKNLKLKQISTGTWQGNTSYTFTSPRGYVKINAQLHDTPLQRFFDWNF